MRPPITVPSARFGYRCWAYTVVVKYYDFPPPPPPQSTAQDGAAASALEQRIRDAQKVR